MGDKKNNFCNIWTNLLIHTHFTCNGLQYVIYNPVTDHHSWSFHPNNTPTFSHGFSISSILCLWWLWLTLSHRATFWWTNAEIGHHQIINKYIYICICLSICLSIYLPTYPSIHPSIHPSISLSVCLSISLSLSLPLPLFTGPPKWGVGGTRVLAHSIKTQ